MKKVLNKAVTKLQDSEIFKDYSVTFYNCEDFSNIFVTAKNIDKTSNTITKHEYFDITSRCVEAVVISIRPENSISINKLLNMFNAVKTAIDGELSKSRNNLKVSL